MNRNHEIEHLLKNWNNDSELDCDKVSSSLIYTSSGAPTVPCISTVAEHGRSASSQLLPQESNINTNNLKILPDNSESESDEEEFEEVNYRKQRLEREEYLQEFTKFELKEQL
jgi:hypothetical protein